jgi:hypothetical protein
MTFLFLSGDALLLLLFPVISFLSIISILSAFFVILAFCMDRGTLHVFLFSCMIGSWSWLMGMGPAFIHYALGSVLYIRVHGCGLLVFSQFDLLLYFYLLLIVGSVD